MILNAFNTLISSNTLSLEDAKSKVRDYASAGFKDEILSKVPSIENVKNQLGTQIVSIDELREVESKFKNIKSRCQFLVSQVDSKIEQIESIQSKINGIGDRFDKIQEIIDIANKIIPTIRIIISIAPTLLAASTGLFANGLVITRINDGLKIAKSKIVELESIVKVLGSVQNYIESQTQPINDSCDSAVEVLQKVKTQIEENCKRIDEFFLQIIATFPNTSIVDNDTKTSTTLPIIEKPEEILDNLENSSKQLFIQYLRDIENNTGYRIVKL